MMQVWVRFEKSVVFNMSLALLNQGSKFCRKLTINNSGILARVEIYDTNIADQFSRAYSTDFQRKKANKGQNICGAAHFQDASTFDQRQVPAQHLRCGVQRFGSGLFGTIPSISIDGTRRDIQRNSGVCARRHFGNRRMYGRQRVVPDAQSRVQSGAGRWRLYHGHHHAQLCLLGAKPDVISVFARLGRGSRNLCDAKLNFAGRALLSTGERHPNAFEFAARDLRQLIEGHLGLTPFGRKITGAQL